MLNYDYGKKKDYIILTKALWYLRVQTEPPHLRDVEGKQKASHIEYEIIYKK